jgi:hypothetical protein
LQDENNMKKSKIKQFAESIHLQKVLTGAFIAGAGAILTYLSEWVAGADFGDYTPLIVAGFSVLSNIVRKLAVVYSTK